MQNEAVGMNNERTPPTLVLIPGLLSDSIVWESTARCASACLPVFDADISRMESITGAARQIIDDVTGDMIVAGHSLGGRIALEAARLAPERLRGLVLADTGTHARQEGEAEKRHAMMELAKRDGMSALADKWLPPMVHPGFHADHPVTQALRNMVLRASVAQHDRQMLALLKRPEADSVLQALTCPLLLLVGRDDQWSPVAQHESMHQQVAGSELAIIDDAGHFAPYEKPDEVAEAIYHWLERRILKP